MNKYASFALAFLLVFSGCLGGSDNDLATDDDESCIFPEIYYDCDGVCLNDFDSDSICDEEDNCIDISNLVLLDNYNTAMVIGVVEESSERHFFLWPPIDGAHNQYTLDDKSRKDLLDCDWLHVSGISLRFSPVKETMLEAMRLCKENNIPVQISMGGGYSSNLRDIIDAHANTFRLAQEIFF